MFNKSHIKDFMTCNRIQRIKRDKGIEFEIDPFIKLLANQGYEYEELVKDRYRRIVHLKKADLNDYNETNSRNQAEITQKLLKDGYQMLFEPVFIYEGLVCRLDILVIRNGKFVIFEIKASNSVKDEHLIDVSFQHYILNKLGYEIESFDIIHTNKNYKHLVDDIPDLSKGANMLKKIKTNNLITDQLINDFKESLKNEEPAFEIKKACFKCELREYCESYNGYSVFDLYYLNASKKLELYNEGLKTFSDLRDFGYKGSLFNQNFLNIGDDTEIIHKLKLRGFLNKLEYPIYYLDFETAIMTVPEFEYTRPKQQNLFQYSLHVKRTPESNLEHYEHIELPNDYSLYRLLEKMIYELGEEGTILAYNKKFEKGVIKDAIGMYPHLADKLEKINNRVEDLMEPLQNGYYYHKDFVNSVSIKKVLPALFKDNKELDYKNVGDVQNGMEATNTWLNMRNQDDNQIEHNKEQLLKYYHLDTLAMVRIHEYLIDKIED